MPKRRFFLAFFFVAALALTAGGFYVRKELRTPYPEVAHNLVLEIPKGLGTREVVELLENQNLVRNRFFALAYLFYLSKQGRLQAGEYMFDRPMTIPEVIDKLVSGNVYLHKFIVPEGLTIAETAQEWERQKFGKAAEFAAAAAASVSIVQSFDEKATSVEGYLFPETYSFPAHTTPRQAIEAMLNRLRFVEEELKKTVPGQWPLSVRETVILASLVETEAAHDNERSLIASVYLNRLRRRILLQCDPTVIYALEQAGRYRGTLLLVDLKFPSAYNTYVNPGLPPGPIANPGYASLLAAVKPAQSKYLFFVRTTEGQHTFSETLAAHNRAVAAYRAMTRKIKKGN